MNSQAQRSACDTTTLRRDEFDPGQRGQTMVGSYGRLSVKRYRSYVIFLALIGLLLQAAFVVRHSVSMVQAKLAHTALLHSLGVICSSDGASSTIPASDLPSIPEPSSNSGDCPICKGLLSAVAVVPVVAVLEGTPSGTSERIAIIAESIAERIAGVRPPPRGPPSLG